MKRQWSRVVCVITVGIALAVSGTSFAEGGKQDSAKKNSIRHFGAPFTLVDAMPIGKVFSDTAQFDGKQVKITATISSVCKKKGCWLVIGTPDIPAKSIRIKMKDYGFFVPTDCAGKNAVVEGQFKRTVLVESMAKHYAEDEGKDPSGIKGNREELQLVATGIDIVE